MLNLELCIMTLVRVIDCFLVNKDIGDEHQNSLVIVVFEAECHFNSGKRFYR